MALSFFEFAPLPRILKVLKAINFIAIPPLGIILSFHIMLVLFLQPRATSQQYTSGFLKGLVDIGSPSGYYAQFRHDQFTYQAGMFYGHFFQVLALLAIALIVMQRGINTADIRWFLTGCLVLLCLMLMIEYAPRKTVTLICTIIGTTLKSLPYFKQGAQSRLADKATVNEPPMALDPPTNERRFGRRNDR